jgi:hypothetical protein
MHWDGKAWTQVPLDPSEVRSSGDLGRLPRWNGTPWTRLSLGAGAGSLVPRANGEGALLRRTPSR